MKIAVRYYTKTGNTRRLAEAVAEALSVPALPISEPLEEPVDLLLLGNSWYAFTLDPEVRAYVKALDRNMVKQIAVFSTAAMMGSIRKKIKAEADRTGIPVAESEFHCRGQFKNANKGRPDSRDLAAAAAWAKSLLPAEENP